MISTKHKLAASAIAGVLILGTALVASAQVTGQPTLAVNLLTTGLSQNAGPGTQNAIMAAVRLDTTGSGDDVRLTSLPLILTTGNNASAAALNSCHFVNPASTNTVGLNTGVNQPSTLLNGMNTFTFDTPLVLPRNTVTTLQLMCNIGPTAAVGGTFTFSVNTANITAVGNTNGVPASVTVGGTVSYPTVPVISTSPGLPNTGAGGDATTNIALVIGSLILASLGLAYTRRLAR